MSIKTFARPLGSATANTYMLSTTANLIANAHVLLASIQPEHEFPSIPAVGHGPLSHSRSIAANRVCRRQQYADEAGDGLLEELSSRLALTS